MVALKAGSRLHEHRMAGCLSIQARVGEFHVHVEGRLIEMSTGSEDAFRARGSQKLCPRNPFDKSKQSAGNLPELRSKPARRIRERMFRLIEIVDLR